MTYVKKYGLRFLYTIISITISLFLLTTLYYFNLISSNIYQILKIIIIILNIFISGFLLGKQTANKGYLEGIKLTLILIPFCLLTSLLTSQPLHIKVLLYYFIIAITAILGSMIGINKRKS